VVIFLGTKQASKKETISRLIVTGIQQLMELFPFSVN